MERRATPPSRRLRRLVPKRVRRLRGRLRAELQRRQFRGLGVEETFDRVYAERWWGDGPGFDSGEGSGEALATPYVQRIRDFIESRGIRSVVDLGCGDFRVGRQLISPDLDYVGVDVVGDLVKRNQRTFGAEKVRFEHRDLIGGELPGAELALLRQVLQHLSNDEIQTVLDNTRRYRYVIITEHVPVGDDVRPNVDKPHGPDIRMPERSGVFVDEPPFSLPVDHLFDVRFTEDQVLRTVLLENAR